MEVKTCKFKNMEEKMDEYIISVGSNINPEYHIDKARAELKKISEFLAESSFAYTKPLQYKDQPNFLNGVIMIRTKMDIPTLKDKLEAIEMKLGRVKDVEASMPRKIEIDILVSNNKVVDNAVFERDFLQKAIKEVKPGFDI
jgi:2-amino-4-hydroxy-6-hydroxymethyldihydropteridine diphosphokinase